MPVRRERPHDVLEHRPVAHRNQRLGDDGGVGPQAGAEPTGKDRLLSCQASPRVSMPDSRLRVASAGMLRDLRGLGDGGGARTDRRVRSEPRRDGARRCLAAAQVHRAALAVHRHRPPQDDGHRGPAQDAQIHRERRAPCVGEIDGDLLREDPVQVVLQGVLHRQDPALVRERDLRQTGDPGTHRQDRLIAARTPRDEAGILGARPYQAHLSAEDVQELRQLVQLAARQERADPAGQPWVVARREPQAGAARAVLEPEPWAGTIREAVPALIGESGERRVARRLRDEMAAMPSPAEVVDRLSALAR